MQKISETELHQRLGVLPLHQQQQALAPAVAAMVPLAFQDSLVALLGGAASGTAAAGAAGTAPGAGAALGPELLLLVLRWALPPSKDATTMSMSALPNSKLLPPPFPSSTAAAHRWRQSAPNADHTRCFTKLNAQVRWSCVSKDRLDCPGLATLAALTSSGPLRGLLNNAERQNYCDFEIAPADIASQEHLCGAGGHLCTCASAAIGFDIGLISVFISVCARAWSARAAHAH